MGTTNIARFIQKIRLLEEKKQQCLAVNDSTLPRPTDGVDHISGVTDADIVPTDGSKFYHQNSTSLCGLSHSKGARCKFVHLTPLKMFEAQLID